MATKSSSGNSRTPTTRPGYREAGSGQFITRKEAVKSPGSTVEESIPLPGHGDTKRR